MIPIDRYWGGYVSGFLTATILTLLICAIVHLYFELKRRRPHTTRMRNF